MSHFIQFYVECRNAECRVLFSFMLNAIMLSVVMLNVVMLSVVAPFKQVFLVSNEEIVKDYDRSFISWSYTHF